MKFSFFGGIFFVFIVWYLLFYYLGRKNRGTVIKVPAFVSIIFGAPIGIGRMSIESLLANISNLVSLFIGIIFYFLTNQLTALKVYCGTLIITFLITNIVSGIVEKDLF